MGLTISSVTLEFSLNKTTTQKVVSECQNLLNNPQRGCIFMMSIKSYIVTPSLPHSSAKMKKKSIAWKQQHTQTRDKFQDNVGSLFLQSTLKNERDKKLGLKKQFGLPIVEASSPVISQNFSTEGNPRDRSVCFQTISSDHYLHFGELERPNPLTLGADTFQQSFYIFPLFCMITKVLSEVCKQKFPMMILLTSACGTQRQWKCPHNNQFYWPGGKIS